MEIKGDVDASFGTLSFKGDIRITGSVKSDCMVDASGSVVVMGDVEDAAVKCGGDLAVLSTVRGGEKSIIECGGNMWTLRLERTVLVAGGDVTVGEEIVNSDVNCKGLLKTNVILGGNIAAAGGVFATTVGNLAGVRTVVDVGAMHGYMKRRDSIKNSINVQNLLTEGYMSELFCNVRDRMDEFGEISEENLPVVDDLIKSLKDSVTVSDDLVKDLDELDTRLKAVAECSISIYEVFPGSHLKLGFTEQVVTSVLKNVYMRPAGIKPLDD
jgi:uncharacterized protein (DUF342 family)